MQNMMQKMYQPAFSKQTLAVCTQLKNSGFLDELMQVLSSRLFNTFNETMSDVELRQLRDKLTAIGYVINSIREGN